MKRAPFRETDLALERKRVPEGKGIFYKEAVWKEICFTALKVTESAAHRNYPVGRTLSLTLPDHLLWSTEEKAQVRDALRFALQLFLPVPPARLLVAGLGNRRLTADSLGPMTADLIEVTAALPETLSALWDLSPRVRVAVSIPDVFPKTGIESVRTVASAARLHHAEAIVTVDALAAREKERLFRVVEITDTGTVPGGGVKTGTASLSQKQLGIPVISIGIPTVVRVGAEHFLVSRGMEEEAQLLSSLLAESINLLAAGVPTEENPIAAIFEP